jgi:hypothetical protein
MRSGDETASGRNSVEPFMRLKSRTPILVTGAEPYVLRVHELLQVDL